MRKLIIIVALCLLPSLCFGANTWNPSDKNAGITLSNGDMTASSTGFQPTVRATHALAGKMYWEVVYSLANTHHCGVLKSDGPLDVFPGYGSTYGWSVANNKKFYNSTAGTTITFAITAGDVIRFAVDIPNGKLWFGKNNSWIGDPAAGTGESYSGLSGTLYPAAAPYITNTCTLKANDADCTYSAPSGFIYYETVYGISGVLKEKESDAAGSALEYLILKRSDGSVLGKGTASASGVYSVVTPDNTTLYDVFIFDPNDVYPPKVIGERVTGVIQ